MNTLLILCYGILIGWSACAITLAILADWKR
jgi:hypothetical protein